MACVCKRYRQVDVISEGTGGRARASVGNHVTAIAGEEGDGRIAIVLEEVALPVLGKLNGENVHCAQSVDVRCASETPYILLVWYKVRVRRGGGAGREREKESVGGIPQCWP